jgi:hypothetical protein
LAETVYESVNQAGKLQIQDIGTEGIFQQACYYYHPLEICWTIEPGWGKTTQIIHS